MCADDEHWSCSFETHTSLDADDGVAHMAVAANGVCGTDFFHLLNGFDFIVEFFAVHTAQFTFLETEFQEFWTFFRWVLQISRLWQALVGVENLTTTDAGSPNTHVVGVLQFCEVGEETVGVEVIHFFLSAEVLVACECDDFHAWSQHEESHVETNLVVTCTS